MKYIFLILSVFALLLIGISACETGKKEEGKFEDTAYILPDTVTFSEHIAPLVFDNCTACHREGQAGPFPLKTYEDLAKRPAMIEKVTSKRIMPPWPADHTYQSYANERVLTEKEILLIKKWVAQGALEGNPKLTPDIPEFPDGSQLGEPDLVLKMEPVHIKGNNRDHFFLIKVPYEIPADTFISVIEFVPGKTQLAHHMNANLIQYAEGAKDDVFGGEKVIPTDFAADHMDIHKRMDLLNDDGTYPKLTPMVCNYLPGVYYRPYPEGIGGYHMKRKGALFINDMHYGPSLKDVIDSSYFNIFFSKRPPERPMQEAILGTLGISEVKPPLIIPPDTIMKFTTGIRIPEDISLITINPHMHMIGKSFLAYAVMPQEDTIPLIHIPDWDFNWQYFYTFKKMLKIPKGSYIHVEGVYDNTADNPFNPYDPPRLIRERDGSMKSTDEMFQFIFNYLPYQSGDEKISLE